MTSPDAPKSPSQPLTAASVAHASSDDDHWTALALRMEALGKAFLERTVADLAALRAHIERARAERDDALLVRAARMAHGIRGAGASFGFGELSACAGSIEFLIRERGPGPDSMSESFLVELARLVVELDTALARAHDSSAAAAAPGAAR